MSAFCRTCKGPLELLGIVGRREWVRCPACWEEYARPVEVLADEHVYNPVTLAGDCVECGHTHDAERDGG